MTDVAQETRLRQRPSWQRPDISTSRDDRARQRNRDSSGEMSVGHIALWVTRQRRLMITSQSIPRRESAMTTETLTRERLYALVWETPMSKLAPTFGLSDNGLAKICRANDIPYPPRGYWAKKEAGQHVAQTPLRKTKGKAYRDILLRASPPRARSTPQDMEAQAAAATVEIPIPLDLKSLHSAVAEWVRDHEKTTARYQQELKRRRHDTWFKPAPVIELTERDRYRFRVTSALLKGVEKLGGRVQSASVRGLIEFSVTGEKVEFTVAEKMSQRIKRPTEEEQAWSAFSRHHQAHLHSTGFLRFSMKSYLGGGKRGEWVETSKRHAEHLLPEVIVSIIAAGPKLVEERKAREEQHRRWEQERAEQAERARLAKIDAERWTRFRGLAADWEEARRLEAFISALRERSSDLDLEIDGRTIRDWLAWADEKLEALDPMRRNHGPPFTMPSPTYGWR